MRTTALALVTACGLAICQPANAQESTPAGAVQPQIQRPLVQLAILLDTSGSMDGLIDQAKTQLWSIVNEFATAKQGEQRPELQVALYEYGKSSIAESEGYLRMILPLSTDLDAVSEQLFALQTNGGDEYCGRVIKAAAEGLAWSATPSDLRVIVIAGNEPFTQGEVDFKDSVRAAVKKGLIINTIHCGDRETGVQTGWEEGARLGEGTYSYIDQGAVVPHIPTPHDDEITRLGTELNTTYIAYGAAGAEGFDRQQAQDANATTATAGAAVQRAVSKGSTLYSNSHWDLVDAVKQKTVKLEDVKEADLPENMRAMPAEERARYVAQMDQKRQELQGKLRDLESKRQQFIAEQRRAGAKDETLGAALRESMQKQAQEKGFRFEKP
jgi:hypothetical protein